VIHRNLSPIEQADDVDRVKWFSRVRIPKPITVRENRTVKQVWELRARKRYGFHSFLVVDAKGELVGLITRRHLEGRENQRLPVGQLMIPFSKLVTAKPDTTKEQAYKLMRRYDRDARQVSVIPLIDGNRRPVGLYTRKDLDEYFEGVSMHNTDSEGRLLVGAAIGVGRSERKRARMLADKGVDVLIVDTAHGHTEEVRLMVRWLKDNLPPDVVAGNISINEAATFLADAGADTVKVGQGPGSICTTREVTSIGVLQATAIEDCSRPLRGRGVYVCADGGIRKQGDPAKALALGASSVMMGSIFAGTTEAPGDVFFDNGQPWKIYRGMGSPAAMRARRASRARYRQEHVPVEKTVAEGIDGRVPYKGDVSVVFSQLAGALRATLGYVGAQSIAELQDKARFKRQTGAGMAESGVHDVVAMSSSQIPSGRTS
jgi:IMP dehydrogenase